MEYVDIVNDNTNRGLKFYGIYVLGFVCASRSISIR